MAKKKYKLPLEIGFAALCTHIRKIGSTADTSASAVVTLSQATADTFGEVEDSLAGKQDITAPVLLSIPITGWGTDPSISDYSYYYDAVVAGLKETDIVDVIIAPQSVSAAQAANFMPIIQSYAGKFRLRAAAIPITAITIQYHITSTQKEET